MKSVDIGIVGGGQLGRMLMLEGHRIGIAFGVLDPSADCPASVMAHAFIPAAFDDQGALEELGKSSGCITYEFEHIDAKALMALAEKGCQVMPSPETLYMIQDKFRQKTFLSDHNLPVPRFMAVKNLEDLRKAADTFGYPLMLKSCKGGYDGKGNDLISGPDEVRLAFDKMGGGSRSLMAEEGIDFLMEISVLAVRDDQENIITFPVGQNIHRNSILHRTIVPAPLPETVLAKARELAMDTMDTMKGVGIFCIEMFVDQQRALFINEIAPRTHNSGHHTIESCNISQFGQQLRALMGWPLMEPVLRKPAVMINLLGDEGGPGAPRLSGIEEAMKLGEVYPHFYGKVESRPGRKMGHVTILADTVEEALAIADRVEGVLCVKVDESIDSAAIKIDGNKKEALA